MIRLLVVSILGGFVAGTAVAQPAADPAAGHWQGVLEAEQRMTRDRLTAMENDLHAQSSRAETERALSSLRSMQGAPQPDPRPGEPAAQDRAAPPEPFPQIPEERLQRSNARVLDAVGDRR